MKIERNRQSVFRVTLHAFELSALVAAARWALGGAEGELTPEARDQLGKVLASYDEEIQRAASAHDSGNSGASGASGDDGASA